MYCAVVPPAVICVAFRAIVTLSPRTIGDICNDSRNSESMSAKRRDDVTRLIFRAIKKAEYTADHGTQGEGSVMIDCPMKEDETSINKLALHSEGLGDPMS